MDSSKVTFQELAGHVATFKPADPQDTTEFGEFLATYGWTLPEYYLEVIQLQQRAMQNLTQQLNQSKPVTVADLDRLVEYMEATYEKRKSDVSAPNQG